MKCVYLESANITQTLDYMFYFRANCTLGGDKEKIENFECAFEQIQALGFSQSAVQKCYDNSFYDVISFEEIDGLKNKNKLLEEDRKKDADLGITLHPGLTINDMSYRGYLEGPDVFDAICSSYNH